MAHSRLEVEEEEYIGNMKDVWWMRKTSRVIKSSARVIVSLTNYASYEDW